jgi:carboxylesterase type B
MRPFEDGRAACTLLGEEPWRPGKSDFDTALSNSLGYRVYQNAASKDQLYWVSKAKACDATCRAIDAQGKVHRVDCGKKLPILCTQGAPVSTSTANNNSVHWQVQQTVGSKVLTGYRDYHVWKFRGIRYADKPERFTYSKVASFDEPGTVNATEAGADCSQPIGEVKSGSSEDCLFANVWTPYLPSSGDKTNNLKPVMLYLYGGGYTSGSGKNPNTDGTNLASRGDVVVVSVNYRVGSLGFLNLNDGVHNGNYAISDMVTALEWIHKYIKYFGGDPDNVTLFGESAGAGSTHAVLGVPQAKGLFHRAALQSSPDGYPGNGKLLAYPYYPSLGENYEATTKKVLEAAACLNATDKIACLSKLSGFDLVTLSTNAK